MGAKKREWTEQERSLVRQCVMAGISQDVIAKALKTNKSTLEKYFRDEIDEAVAIANAAVVGALYDNAIKGNVTAQIFWCKTKLKWREADRLEVTGKDTGPIQAIINFGPKPKT